MSRFDRFLSYALLGLIVPLVLFLALWWSSIPLQVPEKHIVFLVFAGIAAGVVLDITVLKKFIRSLFLLSVPALAGIGIFYSVMVYGFFMGLPLFNSVVGIVFCYVAAKCCVLKKLPRPEAQKVVRRFNVFFAAVLTGFCILSAYFALSEPDIALQIKNMIGLPFEVEMWMIWMLILLGGTLLVLFQYITGRLIADIVLKKPDAQSDA